MKINKDTSDRWKVQVANWLRPYDMSPADVTAGVDAWAIAHRAGLTSEAYKDKTINDAHIQTALEQVFPNAVFRDKKRY